MQFEAATGSVQTLVDDLLPAGFEIQTATVSERRSITHGSVRAVAPGEFKYPALVAKDPAAKEPIIR